MKVFPQLCSQWNLSLEHCHEIVDVLTNYDTTNVHLKVNVDRLLLHLALKPRLFLNFFKFALHLMGLWLCYYIAYSVLTLHAKH